MVDSYLGLIDEAMKREVMDRDLLARLKFFFRLRNLLVHKYWGLSKIPNPALKRWTI